MGIYYYEMFRERTFCDGMINDGIFCIGFAHRKVSLKDFHVRKFENRITLCGIFMFGSFIKKIFMLRSLLVFSFWKVL